MPLSVFEKSGFLNEVGAAIHVAPNATRILKSWGCKLDWLQPVHCETLQIWDAKGNHIRTPIVTRDHQRNLNVHDEWVLTHRVDLHNALRATAAQEIDSRKDAEAGEVVLEDGTKYTADLIVGADGIHSRSVHGIVGADRGRVSTGQNCYRFLVPVHRMRDNPLTADLLARIGLNGVHVFAAQDRRLVMYPCRRGELLNVCGNDAGWHNAGSVSQLLETFHDFGEELQEMCRMAEDVKLWSLASRNPAPMFFRGKLAVIGDAAHPMLPHQGQGAAQAFEDAAALAGVMTADTTVDQISRRLELYNELRYAHAVTVMVMSRINDERRGEMLDELRRYVPNAELPHEMFEFTWPSDPIKEAAHLVATAS
ncbi:uncharacterized protein BDW70DRAFT_153410 [Aspergillus foveolatus]|uniref:uncharacterized protein n=1 Tax=Aspergillus foveolatus TaxID=210207 RepID=UPI003CCD5AF4